MVSWKSIEELALADLLTALNNAQISSSRVESIFHDGTNYVAVYIDG